MLSRSEPSDLGGYGLGNTRHRSNEAQGRDEDVDELDAEEGDDHASQPVDEEVAAQEPPRAQRPEMHPAKRQGDEGDDDESVENDGA